MKQFFKDFKAFAMKGNVLDLAVGVIIGGAFGKIVTSLVNDIVMPLIGMIVGKINLSEASIGTLKYGMFLQSVIDFLLVALCIFLFIKLIARLSFKKKEEVKPAPAVRLCRFCKQPVHEEATRCPHCTSEL
jgi:large conductance mechanosensitive channel